MGMVLSIVQFSASKLQEYIDNPEKFKFDLRGLENNEIDKPVDLDKSWEAINYILTGGKIGAGEPPLSLAIYSQQFFDETQDLGMGPASFLTPQQVQEIHNFLEIVDDDYVKEKFNPNEMNKLRIYRTPWSDHQALFEYIIENLQKLKTFYRDAASKTHAAASYLS